MFLSSRSLPGAARHDVVRHGALRRGLAPAVAAALVASALAVITAQIAEGPAIAAPSEAYTWKNVRVDGGGFVPGIVFNQTEANLIYARTDIGGAYRWTESTQSWTPLLDWVGWDRWGWNGVTSIATDPVQTNRVYAAVGMYTNSWDPNNGAILRSTDKGNTWQIFNLPFKNGGNMPGRGQGERLAVNPTRNSDVYYAAEGGQGLWRSTDFGATFSKVTNFPNVGNYVQDPNDTNGYLSQNQGLTWVTFDKSNGAIYVGVADKANPIYRSTNNGTSWERLAGQPTGFLVHKAVFDDVNGVLYTASSDTGGPYDGGTGQVWKWARATGTWTNITPPVPGGGSQYYGFSGLTIDRRNPNTVMVASQISWWPDAIFWRSTNGGTSWTPIWDWNGYPNRTKRFSMDIATVPWLTFGTNPQPPEETPKLGWMNAAVEIDPFNSNRMLYGTGATIYGTTQLGNWDTNTTFTVRPMVKGLEETAVLDLISPPSGANLISALGDVSGFRHTDLNAVPAMMFTQPNFSSTTSIDFAANDPNRVVRVGNADATLPHIGYSFNNGGSWNSASEPGGVNGGGTVALSADGNRVVWAPGGLPVQVSASFGGGFSQASGVPTGAQVVSDRVNSMKFYGYINGTLYRSTNGGSTFTTGAGPQSGLPTTGDIHLQSVPGFENHLWLTGAGGMWRSTDGGVTFTKLGTNVTGSVNVGFGRAAPGFSYPAIYTMATIDGVTGVYRSNDQAGTWVRINDNNHQWGNAGQAITGDPRIYGRVYVGTNGRGIQYGDSTVTPPSNSPSASASPSGSPSASPSPSQSPSRSPSASPSPSNNPGRSCSATYTITGSWGGAFQADLRVTNTGGQQITGWRVNWTYTAGQTIFNLWNGVATQTGSAVTVVNASYNGTLAPGAFTTAGLQATWNNTSNPVPSPVTCTPL
ncbi:MAG TPA: cellulose binding domain-containing protein [Candidatus Limnocylindrales bacterium]|nr:cellulose binding domain-containing protein [Candidatus Limnocylindrales bacterium]